MAMCGKNCVAIASDTRFGVSQTTLAHDMQRIFKINNTTLLGMSGLQSDVLTVKHELEMQTKIYSLEEHRDIGCRTFNNFVSSFLFSKRFGPYFVEPLVAGLEEGGKPFISGSDSLVRVFFG